MYPIKDPTSSLSADLLHQRSVINAEYLWSKSHKSELVSRYYGKHIVVVDKVARGAYDSHSAVCFAALEKYRLGDFLIRRCPPRVARCYTPFVKFKSVEQ